MLGQQARALGTMGRHLFWSAAGLGALCGCAAVVVIFGPGTFGASSDSGFDAAYLLEFLVTMLPIAMLSGIALGILSWASAYAALGILESRRPEATALHQAAIGGVGSMASGLVPALLIFSTLLSDEPDLGFVYGTTFGLLALCFILAFGTVLVLNRTDASQRPTT